MIEGLQWLGLKTCDPLLLCSTECAEEAVCVPTAGGTTANVRPRCQHMLYHVGKNVAHVGQMNDLDYLSGS